MDQAALSEIKRLEAAGETGDPRYEELLMEHHYVHHVLPAARRRSGPTRWSAASSRSTTTIYVPLQGPSELGASGKLENWDRTGGPRSASTCRRW